MASTYLTRTQSAGNRKTFTISAWVKRSALSTDSTILNSNTTSTTHDSLYFVNDTLSFFSYSGSFQCYLITNRLFRDTSAWYHIVVEVDTTQATSSDRVKIYVNGVQETSFSTETYPSQNYDFILFNNSARIEIGARKNFSDVVEKYFDGSMAHYHFIDGTAYDASAFGETDANGVWTINAAPSVTYGTNGFFILRNSASVTDQSGNGNNWTVAGGTLTDTLDCPDNVFATMNPLENYQQQGTYSNGNNTYQTNTSNFTYNSSTLGVSSGKWYWEVEYDAKSGGTDQPMIGITSTQPTNTDQELGNFANDFGWYTDNGTGYLSNNNSYTDEGFNAYTVGDIISVALDLDNNKLYFAKNGTWEKSGDPTSGATGTGAISITAPSSTPLGAYFPSVAFGTGSYNGTFKANFGNGYFGTTQISSAGTNASGNGIFEYDVPTGYTALSTKGLNL